MAGRTVEYGKQNQPTRACGALTRYSSNSVQLFPRSTIFSINNHTYTRFAIGTVTLDELMTGLISAHETFQQAMDVEIREEVNRGIVTWRHKGFLL